MARHFVAATVGIGSAVTVVFGLMGIKGGHDLVNTLRLTVLSRDMKSYLVVALIPF
jgi:hypothetical protein